MNQDHISRSVLNVIKAVQKCSSDSTEQVAILGAAKGQLVETLQAEAMRQVFYDALKKG